MRRRDFVLRLPVFASGVLSGAAGLALGACGGVAYLVPAASPGRLSVPASSLASGEAFVQAPGMSRPIYVRRSSSGDLVAVLASCTHAGCQPEPVADRLVCPCHGSEFTFDGQVLQGPAERPLTRYAVREEGGEIAILLDGEPGR